MTEKADLGLIALAHSLAGEAGHKWEDLTAGEQDHYRGEAMKRRVPEGVGTWSADPADPTRPPIPVTVSHAEFLAALQPLCDLLNVTPYEVYQDVRISGAPRDSLSIARIAFNVVAPEATIPSTTRYGEWNEVSVRCTVEVV